MDIELLLTVIKTASPVTEWHRREKKIADEKGCPGK
jgi:hypothetical protein